MQVIIYKYVQVLCVTVSFWNNINCDRLLLHNQHEDQHLYRISSCTAKCLDGGNKPNKTLPICYKMCSEEASASELSLRKNTALSFNIELICRDSTSLVIRLIQIQQNVKQSEKKKLSSPRAAVNDVANHSNKSTVGTSEKGIIQKNIIQRTRRAIESGIPYSEESNKYQQPLVTELVYLLKVQEAANELSDRIVYMSNESLIRIENLNANKVYNVTATVITSNNEYIYVDQSKQFKTLPYNYTPGIITEIEVRNFFTSATNASLLDAIISWKPALDKTCHYEILCHASHSQDFYIKPIDVLQPIELYKYKITSLELDSEYVLSIRGKNTKNPVLESALKWHTFQTPSCFEWHNNSEICAPENVENMFVRVAHLFGNNYQFNISWDKPHLIPDYYTVKLLDINPEIHDETANSVTRNVSGDATGLFIESFTCLGQLFDVIVIAHANNKTSFNYLTKGLPKDHWNGGRLALIILTPILIIGLVKMFVSLICKRKAKMKRYEQRCEYFKDLEQKAPVDPASEFEIKIRNLHDILEAPAFSNDLITPIDDEMEIDLDQVKLTDILGEGAFGLVRKGILVRSEGKYDEVAVKMLKACPTLEDVKEFRREIEVMKSVGHHEHVVGIVGHYTKNISEMMLLTEYCSEGNLLNYLRSHWNSLSKIRKLKGLSPDVHLINNIEYFNKCLPSAVESTKKPENVFNFDTSFANDKKSLAYKNISSECNQTSVTQIIENKLYPLLNEDIKRSSTKDKQLSLEAAVNTCTSACKCNVDILEQSSMCTTKGLSKTPHSQIKISGCDCSQTNELSKNHLRCNLVVNRCYYQQLVQQADIAKPCISSAQLLDFARQIASGMDFLARNKVVHRDLAARNVLVCSVNIVKISDFGLSRDIYQENLYRKTGNGKLPIKWLALESLTHQLYTSQSDVWSYGILLYEICTLGGNPYPLLSTADLIAELKRGYRMEKPASCSQGLYDLMLSCWSSLPIDRPTFSKIQSQIDELIRLSKESNIPVINLEANLDSNSTNPLASDHSYLKPVEY